MSKPFLDSADSGFDGSVSIAVVTAVARRRDVEPTELPPLYEAIDPDALDALFESTRRGGSRHGQIEFTYDGHAITVESADELQITIDGTPTTESISANGIEFAGEPRTDA